jgi:hypothetical protein
MNDTGRSAATTPTCTNNLLGNASGQVADDARVDVEKVITSHTGLTSNPSSNDDNLSSSQTSRELIFGGLLGVSKKPSYLNDDTCSVRCVYFNMSLPDGRVLPTLEAVLIWLKSAATPGVATISYKAKSVTC